MLPPASTHIIKYECSVAIVLASPATTLAVAITYVNDVKIIASFNFYVIPGIISRDEHVGTFGSDILGNIVTCYVTMENGDVHKYVSLFA